MNPLSEIVDEIEANKDAARDAADDLRTRDHVVDARNMAGNLHVQVDDDVDLGTWAADVEDEFDATADAHHKQGTRPRLDGPRLSNDEVVFTM